MKIEICILLIPDALISFVSTGSLYKFKGSDNWWAQYYRNGKKIPETTGTSDRREAEKFLLDRMGKKNKSTFIDPQNRRIMVDELYEGLLDDYRANQRDSLSITEHRWEWKDKSGTVHTGRLKNFLWRYACD